MICRDRPITGAHNVVMLPLIRCRAYSSSGSGPDEAFPQGADGGDDVDDEPHVEEVD